MENFDHSNLTIKQLKLFLMVLDTNSVGNAAADMELNQSTVSYSLDRLRDVFSDPLFVKQGRGIVPTEKAKRIAPQIRDVLLQLESLTTVDEYVPGKDLSEFTIATNVMELLPYCDQIFRRIRKLSPGVTVRLLELGSRGNIRQTLETQSANIVISVRSSPLSQSLNSAPLLSCEQVCFYDGDVRGPINSVEEYCLAKHATLDFGGASSSTIDLTLNALSLSRKVQLKAPNILALARLMKGTDLVTTMQSDLHRHAMAGFRFCQPPITVPDVNFDLIWHRRSEFSKRNIWLRSIVQESVRSIINSSQTNAA